MSTWTPERREKRREQRRARRQRLIDLFGGECEKCHIREDEHTKLEFAHRVPNHVCGEGRGTDRRYKDIEDNPENYMLLCKIDHYDYDHPEDPDGLYYEHDKHWS